VVRDLRVCCHVGFFILRSRDTSGRAKGRASSSTAAAAGARTGGGLLTAGGEHIEINVTADPFLPPVPFIVCQNKPDEFLDTVRRE
jgi:hypothetical protein